MANFPFIKFFPADFIRDTRMLSLAAKGAWIDLLCFMWSSQNRGILTYTMVGYSRLIGATVDQTTAVIKELTDMHVLEVVTDGEEKLTLTCRRMVREENKRKGHAQRQEKYRDSKKTVVALPKRDKRSDAKSDAKVTGYIPEAIFQKEITNVISLPPTGDRTPETVQKPEIERPKKERPKDPVWDTVAELLFEPTTKQARSRIGQLVAAIKESGSADPDEIRRRAGNYRVAMPDCPFTPEAFLKHWDQLVDLKNYPQFSGNGNGRGQYAKRPSPVAETPEQALERMRAERDARDKQQEAERIAHQKLQDERRQRYLQEQAQQAQNERGGSWKRLS